jgi:hypothetical protein
LRTDETHPKIHTHARAHESKNQANLYTIALARDTMKEGVKLAKSNLGLKTTETHRKINIHTETHRESNSDRHENLCKGRTTDSQRRTHIHTHTHIYTPTATQARTHTRSKENR